MKNQAFNTKTAFPLLVGAMLLLASNVFAQGFFNTYPVNMYVNNKTWLDCTPNGYCATAPTVLNQPDSAFTYVGLSTDADGNQTALDSVPHDSIDLLNAYMLGCNSFLLAKSVWATNTNTFNHLKMIDLEGQTIWEDTLPQVNPGLQNYTLTATRTTDGNILLVGGNPFYIQKLDNAGNVLATTTPPMPIAGAQYFQVYDLWPTAGGGALANMVVWANNTNNWYFFKIASDGSVEWTVPRFVTSGSGSPDGSAFALQSAYNDPAGFLPPTLFKYDGNGALLWEVDLRTALGNNTFASDFVLATNDNGAIVQGTYNPVPGTALKVSILARFDAAGNLLWQKGYTGQPVFQFSNGKALPDGGFAFSGISNGKLALLEINGNGAIEPNAVAGSLVRDEDGDCQADAGETPLAGWIVRATATNGAEYYGVTLSDGSFIINDLPGGPAAYDLEMDVQTPSYLWLPCPIAPLTMPANAVNVTLNAGLAAEQLADCPVMSVELGVWNWRRCVNRSFSVKYCNNGTATAEDAAVEVYLPAEFTMVNAGIPYTQTGQTVRFEVGDVAPNDCEMFWVTVYVSCDSTQLGQAVCVEAHVFPDSFCVSPPNWSGACLEAEAECLNDSVQLTVRNTGIGATTQSLDYLIIDDDVVMSVGSIPAGFGPGDAVVTVVPADGSTFRVSSGQEPNHPLPGNPSVAVEGCNGMNLGFVTQFANLTGNPFSDLECREIIGSYDPNEKIGYPEGVHSQHFIEPGTRLEYVLHFQNTGTDTAFRVVLRDTLSQWLDPMTLRPGAASHPYTWRLEGSGQLIFSFDPIALPDSNANLEASNGFVQFAVRMRPNVPLKTVIENRVGIYFDQNPVVLTNTVFHTVDTGFLEVSVVSTHGGAQPLTDGLDIFPNPATEQVSLALKSNSPGTKTLVLLDALGKVVLQKNFPGGQVELRRAELPAGVYFVKIVENQRVAALGKVVWR